MKNILLIILTTLILSCVPQNSENCHNAVTIKNTSNKVIYFVGGSPTPQILAGANPLISGNYFKILPNNSKKDIFGRDRGCYEELFAENNNKLYYLIFDEQVLLNNTWEDVVANDMVLERYGFTVEQMNTANWVITYDGN